MEIGGNMEIIIIEVGSTVTKVDLYDGVKVRNIEEKTIWFKRHYNEENKLNISDIEELIKLVKEKKEKYENIYVCGTSIFRSLGEDRKKAFLDFFLISTGVEFHIINQEDETKYTAIGATKNINKKVGVFIGGGGSTEIAICENGKIIEMSNTKMGVMDIMEEFPDLGDDLATTDVKTVREFIRKKLNLPKNKVDILILAGGGHLKFAINSGISYEKNTLFNDEDEPIMMSFESRKKDTEKYFNKISLDEIRNRVEDPKWWFATRAMSAEVLEAAENMNVKYIVPTNIPMIYGIMKKEL